jgi:hypothetical protein
MWAYKLLRTKYFHGVSSGNQPPYLLKSRYGKVSELLPKVFAILKQDYEKAIQRLFHLGSWWRRQIERFTKFDPLVCPVCLIPLALISVAYTTSGGRDAYG